MLAASFEGHGGWWMGPCAGGRGGERRKSERTSSENLKRFHKAKFCSLQCTKKLKLVFKLAFLGKSKKRVIQPKKIAHPPLLFAMLCKLVLIFC